MTITRPRQSRLRALKRVGPLALAISLAGPVVAQSSDNPADLRPYLTANGLLNRGMYDLAAAEYRTFLDKHADHEKASTARYGLAVCLFRTQQFEEASEHLGTLLPESGFQYAAEVRLLLGQSQFALQDYDSAATSFRALVESDAQHDLADDAAALWVESLYRADELDSVGPPGQMLIERWPESPHRQRTLLFWGLSDMARREYGSAATRFESIVTDAPSDPLAGQAALLLAQCRHRSDSLESAADWYRRVIDRAEERFVPDALYGLATLLQQQGEPKEAAKLLDLLLDSYADDELVPSALLVRGRVSFDRQKYQRAIEFLKQARKADDERHDEIAYWMAKCELRTGKYDQAAQRLGEAIQRHPDSGLLAEMHYDRGITLLKADDRKGAVKQFEEFHAHFGQHDLDAEAVHLIASIRHQLGQYDESLQACRAFFKQHRTHELAPRVAFLAAESTYLAGRYEDAATSYRDFLDQFPTDSQAPKATLRLGMALYRVGRFDDASPYLLDAAKKSGTYATFQPALLALGDIAFQQDEWEEAADFLSEYLDANPKAASADDALLKLGLARQRQGHAADALRAYDRLLSSSEGSPHRLQTMFERGQSLLALQRDEEAARMFIAVLEESPDSLFGAHAMNHLGAIAMRLEMYADAANYYGRAADADLPKHLQGEAMFQKGQALMAAQRFDDAVDTFSRLAADHSRMGESRAQRAIALARLDKHESALDAINEIDNELLTSLDRELQSALLYEKAWCLRELDNPADAAEVYRALLALEIDRDLRSHAVLELAEIEVTAERYDLGSELLRELRVDIETGDFDVPDEVAEQSAYLLGVCEFRLDEFASASTLLEEYLQSNPEGAQAASALLLCGEALARTGHHQQAMRWFEKIRESHRDDPAYGPALLRLGDAAAALQLWTRSEKAFEEYLVRFGDSDVWYQAQFGVGWACENQSRYDEAIDAYRRVVDRHQGTTAARAQFQIGECLYAKREFQQAVAELLKVDILYGYPQWSAAALFEAGRCFEELGDPARARSQFELVKAQHADSEWATLAAERLAAISAGSALPGRSPSGLE